MSGLTGQLCFRKGIGRDQGRLLASVWLGLSVSFSFLNKPRKLLPGVRCFIASVSDSCFFAFPWLALSLSAACK